MDTLTFRFKTSDSKSENSMSKDYKIVAQNLSFEIFVLNHTGSLSEYPKMIHYLVNSSKISSSQVLVQPGIHNFILQKTYRPL